MKKGIIAAIILIIVLAGLFGWRVLKLNKKPTAGSGNELVNRTAKQLSEEELKVQYESAVKEILAPFFAGQSPEGIKEKLLELTVPYIYKDLHLNLVIALSMIETGGVEADQAKVEEGMEKLEELKEEYDWIGEEDF